MEQRQYKCSTVNGATSSFSTVSAEQGLLLAVATMVGGRLTESSESSTFSMMTGADEEAITAATGRAFQTALMIKEQMTFGVKQFWKDSV